MTKSDIELKLKCIESEIEIVTTSAKLSKKSDISLLVIGIATTVIILFIIASEENLHVLDVFSISLLASTLHKHMIDMIKYRNDNNHALTMLELDKKFYTIKLKRLEEVEEL